ncbi:MAG: PAS domain-containing protein [Clostridia bacterium]|nr:PAS domain-containing protein [Clostridia bacterium]
MEHLVELIIMIISEFLIIGLYEFIRKQKRGKLKTIFIIILLLMFVWTLNLIMQILFQNTNIDPFVFEKLVSVEASLMPVAVLFLGIIFSKPKMTFKWYHYIVFIIPIITIIMTITNDYHNLMMVEYSKNYTEIVWGPYFTIHSVYSYICMFIGIIYIISYSSKNSGFFSKQSILILIGTLIPVVINILAIFSKINMTSYIMPISYSITVMFFALSIFRFKVLSLTPIALQRIVDRISDSYMVINEDNIITDFNKTLLTILKIKDENVRNKNIFEFIRKYEIDIEKIQQALIKVLNSNETETFEIKIEKVNRYFSVEINTIKQKQEFLGILILLKDITQHKEDMETIQNNQNILIERERLASLGQMIGGIAHNLKTPIMSISGAAEGLNELIREYELSIDNPQVNSEDHHAIVKDMDEWIRKIRNYTEYMSDIITAVKGQAVNFADEQQQDFTVGELVKHVNILMRHELKNAIVYLNSQINCNEDIEIKGNINSLVQVINNMISNAIQAYKGEPDKNIDMIINTESNNIIITIRDYGPGLPEQVKEKLFKEMVTTKGKNGTGLGLYMSYSNIRAHFSGDITVNSEAGKGTEFNIVIPIKK